MSDNRNGNEAAAAAAAPTGKERMQQEFDALHREMEIAEYATTDNGQYRKKVPRAESQVRTRKRKLLEQSDIAEHAIHAEDLTKRMRGSRQAMNEDVIAGSRVFHEEGKSDDDDHDHAATEGFDEEQGEDNEGEDVSQHGQSNVGKSDATRGASTQPKRRRMYRMRNFKSLRMAERHGDALGAHAQGKSREAVEKLEQVAADAPAAPQVYSSLGLVYESLLSESRRGKDARALEGDDEAISLEKQIDLAKKAYGSYHVSAVLCKKDFTLWLRAADTAVEVADLCSEAMKAAEPASQDREDARVEKKKWLEEAKKDYTTADNLKPPGIDVPAKLADVQIQLGNLAEALTLLTDLKNRAPRETLESDTVGARGAFARSYNAWLLYADLMLRIGHECTQWNRGIETNQNYMFRRWLRKYSKTFDWQERRLQALCLALEAAAGSDSCKKIIRWARRRMLGKRQRQLDSYETGAVGDDEDADASGNENNEDHRRPAESEIGLQQEPSFETQRDELVKKNRGELVAFDEDTTKLGLTSGSKESVARAAARSELVHCHKESILALVGSFQQQKAQEEGAEGEMEKAPLPLSASCATVCSIASLLMKHCLGLELYDGSRLAAESVSLYFKERASMREQRLESNRAFEQKQKSTDDSVLLNFEAYDEIDDRVLSDEDDDSEVQYLSDDELIEGNASEELVASLRNGILPPEIRFLYGLSLIGEGGRHHLVARSIGAIADLQDGVFGEVETDLEVVPDPLWPAFRRAMTEPLQKTSGLAFAADLVHKVQKDEKYAHELGPFLTDYLLHLEAGAGLKAALSKGHDDVDAIRQNQVAKIVLFASRIGLHLAERVQHENDASGQEKAFDLVVAIIDRLSIVLLALWKVLPDGSIPSGAQSALKLLGKAFGFLDHHTSSWSDDIFKKVTERLRKVLSVLVGYPIPNIFADANEFGVDSTWTNLPLPEDWQTPIQRELSTRVHNLLVGCNVTWFSGWERGEFSLNLMRRRDGRNHFGVDVSEGRVAGYVSSEVEAELARQWEIIGTLIPKLPSVDVPSALTKAKETSWYNEARDEGDEDPGFDAVNGETEAVLLFLMFSRLCLQTPKITDSLISTALSVILPTTQFAIAENIWRSSEGLEDAISPSAVEKWKQVAEEEKIDKEDAVRRRRSRPASSAKPAAMQDFPSSLVSVSVSTLLALWNDGIPPSAVRSGASLNGSPATMEKLDMAMRQLRGCYTDAAVARVCVNVAESLLELVAAGQNCANPFLGLQQAVVFASHGSKGGSNDEPFKKPLPPEMHCTPLEALCVLGRAECLQALHFPDEAAFLCGYVARVCRLHRQMGIHSQWKAVAICAYNASVAIRDAALALAGVQVEPWDSSVVEELKLARLDGIKEHALRADHRQEQNVSTLDPDSEIYHYEAALGDIDELYGVGSKDVGIDDEEEAETIEMVPI